MSGILSGDPRALVSGGKPDLDKNVVTDGDGREESAGAAMRMKANLLDSFALPKDKAVTTAKTGADPTTYKHARNWMECVRSRGAPHAGALAGYRHGMADIMTAAALHAGRRAAFDEETREIMAGGRVFRY